MNETHSIYESTCLPSRLNYNERLLELVVVLHYDSITLRDEGKSYLSTGQRICINQERAFLMREYDDDREFEQSHIVDQKIDFILQKVRETNIENLYMAHARSLTII